MFKLPSLPSPNADINELADFAELTSWERRIASKREIVAYLNRIDENDNNIGCDDDEDENSDILDDVMIEIERRIAACGKGYPFSLDNTGTILSYKSDDDNKREIIYLYLLLSTRLNMKDDRTHAGIDGTLLLEELSASVLKEYLGSSRSRVHIFGTAVSGNFQSKIEKLCDELCEGGGYRSLDPTKQQAQDDKLDTVAWVPFSDNLAGQIIIFGQCKTGSNWSGLITQLQPDSFIKKWMKEPVLVNPLRAFFLSESIDRSRWKGWCVDAGIVFDRCRLIDFCDNIDSTLYDKIKLWTITAKSTVNIAKSV